jgi:hypothetical protein
LIPMSVWRMISIYCKLTQYIIITTPSKLLGSTIVLRRAWLRYHLETNPMIGNGKVPCEAVWNQVKPGDAHVTTRKSHFDEPLEDERAPCGRYR